MTRLWCLLLLCFAALGCASTAPPPTVAASPARAGSLARFIVHGPHLYAVDGQELRVYDLQSGLGLPAVLSSLTIPADAETLFAAGDLLFVGTRQGLLVYELADHPMSPKLLGRGDHVVSCDPVVVEGDTAFVTLRDGSIGCARGLNALLVFDVKDPTTPRQIAQTSMASPRGLGVDGAALFVADAQEGLVVFDVQEPSSPKRLQTLPSVGAYDVIPHAGTLFVSTAEGLFQYRYAPTGALDPTPVSRIPFGGPALQVASDVGAR